MLRDAVVVKVNPNQFGADIQYRDSAEIQRDVKMAGRVYWNVKVGDYVIVAFLDGQQDNPIILDKVMLKGDSLIENSSLDDIHLVHEVKNDDGDVTGRIEFRTDKNGKLTVDVSGETGSIEINADGTEGKLTINCSGDIEVNSGGDVKIDGAGFVSLGSNLAKHLVNDYPTCLFTGLPHAVFNINTKV